MVLSCWSVVLELTETTSKDFEKAKNADIWPYRVNVRMFKYFSNKPKQDKKEPLRDRPSKEPGTNQQGSILTSNRFDPLARLGSTSSIQDLPKSN